MCFFGDCRVIRLSPHISLTSYFALEKQRVGGKKRSSGGRGDDECSSLNKTRRVETVGGPKVTILNGNEGEGKGGGVSFLKPPASACRYVKAVMISHYDLHRKLKGVLNDVCQCRWRFLEGEKKLAALFWSRACNLPKAAETDGLCASELKIQSASGASNRPCMRAGTARPRRSQ